MLIKEVVFTLSQITVHFFEMPEEDIRQNLPTAVGFEKTFRDAPPTGLEPVTRWLTASCSTN